MKKNEIWVFVRGGCVQEVRANDPQLKVNLIDYDNLEVSDEDEKEYSELELLSEGKPVVF